MSEHAVVIRGMLSRDSEIIARIRQVHAEETERWRVRSARCHIQLQSFGDSRLGTAVSYSLGVIHPLIITRSGDRVTICEVEMEEVDMVGITGEVDLPTSKTIAIHETVLAGLDGSLRRN